MIFVDANGIAVGAGLGALVVGAWAVFDSRKRRRQVDADRRKLREYYRKKVKGKDPLPTRAGLFVGGKQIGDWKHVMPGTDSALGLPIEDIKKGAELGMMLQFRICRHRAPDDHDGPEEVDKRSSEERYQDEDELLKMLGGEG